MPRTNMPAVPSLATSVAAAAAAASTSGARRRAHNSARSLHVEDEDTDSTTRLLHSQVHRRTRSSSPLPLKRRPWTKAEVNNLKATRDQAHTYRMWHYRAAMYYHKLDNRISLPAYLLQILTAGSALSALQQEDTDRSMWLAGIATTLSVSSLILKGISDYKKFAKLERDHKEASEGFSELAREITRELHKLDDERQSSVDFTLAVDEKYSKLKKTTDTIPQHIIDEYNAIQAGNLPRMSCVLRCCTRRRRAHPPAAAAAVAAACQPVVVVVDDNDSDAPPRHVTSPRRHAMTGARYDAVNTRYDAPNVRYETQPSGHAHPSLNPSPQPHAHAHILLAGGSPPRMPPGSSTGGYMDADTDGSASGSSGQDMTTSGTMSTTAVLGPKGTLLPPRATLLFPSSRQVAGDGSSYTMPDDAASHHGVSDDDALASERVPSTREASEQVVSRSVHARAAAMEGHGRHLPSYNTPAPAFGTPAPTAPQFKPYRPRRRTVSAVDAAAAMESAATAAAAAATTASNGNLRRALQWVQHTREMESSSDASDRASNSTQPSDGVELVNISVGSNAPARVDVTP